MHETTASLRLAVPIATTLSLFVRLNGSPLTCLTFPGSARERGGSVRRNFWIHITSFTVNYSEKFQAIAGTLKGLPANHFGGRNPYLLVVWDRKLPLGFKSELNSKLLREASEKASWKGLDLEGVRVNSFIFSHLALRESGRPSLVFLSHCRLTSCVRWCEALAGV